MKTSIALQLLVTLPLLGAVVGCDAAEPTDDFDRVEELAGETDGEDEAYDEDDDFDEGIDELRAELPSRHADDEVNMDVVTEMDFQPRHDGPDGLLPYGNDGDPMPIDDYAGADDSSDEDVVEPDGIDQLVADGVIIVDPMPIDDVQNPDRG